MNAFSVLFDPDDIVEPNSVLGQLVKVNIKLLQKCMTMKQKVIYLSAIDNLVNASNMFGPALNKHLPVILPLVAKRHKLANPERIEALKEALLENGGKEAQKMLNMYPIN